VSREDTWLVEGSGPISGELQVNGDKSVSHRSLLVGAVCDGPVHVTGFGASADTRATLEVVRALGVTVDELSDTELVVHGVGLRGLTPPSATLDVRNAGTLLRLLPGLLAGQPGGTFTLDGDASIRRRPVDRIAVPLAAMGAELTSDEGRPPLTVSAGHALTGITYELPVASAQVKSCILLAGLYAAGATKVIEPLATRDHTERLLQACGARVERQRSSVTIHPAQRLALDDLEVPGDFSSAAFFIVAATIVPESMLFLRGVGINPGRIGLLAVLERMGARIGVFNRRVTAAGEPIADIEVHHAELVATEVEPADVPSMIDELPLLALAASRARGTTIVRGAEDLRKKESDRIATVTEALLMCGARIASTDDGWEIRGLHGHLRGGTVDPEGDHRIAMMAAIAGLYSEHGVRVREPACIDVSFPGFRGILGAFEAAVAERE
jgi:3-phosphoshikimate 1-carboxyvinyltransferase